MHCFQRLKKHFVLVSCLQLMLICSTKVVWGSHFPKPDQITGPFVCIFAGYITINGTPSDTGDEVAFFDSQGIICGLFTVTHSGQYGFVHIYGDDPGTLIDEGVSSDESISVKVWDASEQIEYKEDGIVFSPGNIGGSTVPSALPPVWTNNTTYALNIDVNPKKVQGDINGDGEVNIYDLIRCLQLLSHYDLQENDVLNVDMNNDNLIGLQESIYIMMNISK